MNEATYPGVKVISRFEKPGEIKATLQITMSVGQWRHIAEKLSTEVYEEWPLRAAILSMVRQIEKTLLVETDPQK